MTEYNMFRIYSNVPTFNVLREGWTDLEALKFFIPLYEDQGMAVAIHTADGAKVYETAF